MSRLLAIPALVRLLAAAAVATKMFGNTSGEDTKWHFASAQAEMLASRIEAFRQDTGHLPVSLNDLLQKNGDPAWRGPYARPQNLEDPWGVPFSFQANSVSGKFVLSTLGRDGQIGGSGEDADIQVGPPPGR